MMDKIKTPFDEITDELRAAGVPIRTIPDKFRGKGTDIHISVGTAVQLCCYDGQSIPLSDHILTPEDISGLFCRLCDYSVYKHNDEIKEGYITVFGKYRCGISGTAVRRGGEITSVKDVNSMNIRIPRFVEGVSLPAVSCKADLLDGVLLVGPPSSGKTTILRDIICRFRNERITVVDERRELSWGVTDTSGDFMLGFTKAEAISRAIRSLSPWVILCDEIAEGDIVAMKKASASGVSFIASVHGDPYNWCSGILIRELVNTGAFGRIAVLEGRNSPGKLKEVIDINGSNKDLRDCFSVGGRGNGRLSQAQKDEGPPEYAYGF